MRMKINTKLLSLVAIGIFASFSLCVGCTKKGAADPASSSGQDPRASGAAQAATGSAQAGARQGAGAQGGGRKQMIVPVQATTVQAGILSSDRSTAGVVGTTMQSQVATQVAGVVKSLRHVSGDWVKAGEIVVQLDDSQLKLSLANAQASLDNAKINLAIGQDNADQANPKLSLQVQSAQSAVDSAQKFYDSQKALFNLGGLSASALDTAASQLTAAKANLEGAKSALDQNAKIGDQTIAQLRLAVVQSQNQLAQAQLNLQYASIRAPFAGQIAAVNMQAGMYAGLNTPVFTLVSADRQINFSIAPSDAPALPLGTAVTFAYNGKSYPVKVSQAPSAPINGVVPLSASVPGSFKLPFGSVGSVFYKIAIASGILVPLNALDTLENQNYVFLIIDGRAVTKNVTILGEAGITTAVDGINPGDVVVVNPPPGLIQGSQVQAVMMAGASGSSPAPMAAQNQQAQSDQGGASQPGKKGARQGAPQGAGGQGGSGAPAAGKP
jgi:HlyD family secretion protein